MNKIVFSFVKGKILKVITKDFFHNKVIFHSKAL